MKDLALLILNQIPKYFSNFISLLVGPKRFVRERNDDKQQTIAEAMIFFGISFVITMILSWPLMPTHVESAQFLVTRALLNLILVTVATGLTLASWKLVGGHATFGKYFVINCYYSGVFIIGNMLVLIIAFGVVKALDPKLHLLMVDSFMHVRFENKELNALITDPDDRRHLWAALAFYLIYLIGFVAICLWTVLGWGAFREINGLSKTRSFVAGMIAGVLTAIVIPITLLIQYEIG
jgi:hypothetical protein